MDAHVDTKIFKLSRIGSNLHTKCSKELHFLLFQAENFPLDKKEYGSKFHIAEHIKQSVIEDIEETIIELNETIKSARAYATLENLWDLMEEENLKLAEQRCNVVSIETKKHPASPAPFKKKTEAQTKRNLAGIILDYTDKLFNYNPFKDLLR